MLKRTSIYIEGFSVNPPIFDRTLKQKTIKSKPFEGFSVNPPIFGRTLHGKTIKSKPFEGFSVNPSIFGRTLKQKTIKSKDRYIEYLWILKCIYPENKSSFFGALT